MLARRVAELSAKVVDEADLILHLLPEDKRTALKAPREPLLLRVRDRQEIQNTPPTHSRFRVGI